MTNAAPAATAPVEAPAETFSVVDDTSSVQEIEQEKKRMRRDRKNDYKRRNKLHGAAH